MSQACCKLVVCGKVVPCKSAFSRPFLSKEASDVNTACSSSIAGGDVHVSFAASSQTHSVQPIMLNCQFSNCTINFNTYK